MSEPTHVVVVVPAHDEEERIAACLAGLLRATDHPGLARLQAHVVVVLDDCRDATGARATAALAEWPARLAAVGGPGARTAAVVDVAARNVGQARAFGFQHAIFEMGPVDPEAVWLATTDADSVVPGDWLAHHLQLRQAGAEGSAGLVVVDSWHDHPSATRRKFEAGYPEGEQGGLGHPHVHGTNLGVSMAAYVDAGGFPGLATGEDHALWRALIEAGRRLVATRLAPVTTSGRRLGRSPAGFADTLVRLDTVVA